LSDPIPVYQPTAVTPRYTVRTEASALASLGFVAWVHDAQAGPHAPNGLACWCGAVADAERIAAALNRDECFRERARTTFVETGVPA
jgi:hypothetical protein